MPTVMLLRQFYVQSAFQSLWIDGYNIIYNDAVIVELKVESQLQCKEHKSTAMHKFMTSPYEWSFVQAYSNYGIIWLGLFGPLLLC